MDHPEREDGTVVHGADQVLLDEGVDLVQGLVDGQLGFSLLFIRGHGMNDEAQPFVLSRIV